MWTTWEDEIERDAKGARQQGDAWKQPDRIAMQGHEDRAQETTEPDSGKDDCEKDRESLAAAEKKMEQKTEPHQLEPEKNESSKCSREQQTEGRP